MLCCSCPMLSVVLSLMVSFTPYRWQYIGPCVVNRPKCGQPSAETSGYAVNLALIFGLSRCACTGLRKGRRGGCRNNGRFLTTLQHGRAVRLQAAPSIFEAKRRRGIGPQPRGQGCVLPWLFYLKL